MTKDPRFVGPVTIYTTSVIQKTAPIWKDNHINIEVIKPEPEGLQTQPRTEWETDLIPLSKIPHILLGSVSNIASSADILLFFPRAIHQDPHHGYYANKVPKDVQDFFWDNVLLPALQETSPTTREPYTAASRSHAKFKQGMRKGNQASTLIVGPPQIDKLFSKMKEIVRITQFICYSV